MALLLAAPMALPVQAAETVFTCINNADGTSTCVSDKVSRTLTCTRAGSGVVSCTNPAGEQLNCVISAGNTVSCRDPERDESLNCVGVGLGETACERRQSDATQPNVITDPGLFSQPIAVPDATPMPDLGLPQVIELPSAF